MTAEEHLAECKQTALAYVAAGDLMEAVLSMACDIQKHDETRMSDRTLEALVLATRFEWHPEGIRRWINGFR